MIGQEGPAAGLTGQPVGTGAAAGALSGQAIADGATAAGIAPDLAAPGVKAQRLSRNDVAAQAAGGRLAGQSFTADAAGDRLGGAAVAATATNGRLAGTGVSADAANGRLAGSGLSASGGRLGGQTVSTNAQGDRLGAPAAPVPRPNGALVRPGDAAARLASAGITVPAGVAPTGPGTASGIVYLHVAPLAGATERGPDWILDQVGDTRSLQGLTVFADPTTEQGLIRQALVQQTGRALLDPSYTDPEQQRQALYRGTVAYLTAHPDLHLGDTLTAAEKAAVTTPMLWYETRVLDGRATLVPVLLLPPGDLDRYAPTAGGQITGGDVFLSGDTLTNTGAIAAAGTLLIDAGTFTNERRVVGQALQPGGTVSAADLTVFTKGDLIDRGGAITASDTLTLQAGGSILIASQAVTTTALAGGNDRWIATTSTTQAGALVAAGGDLTIRAGGSLSVLGSTVAAGGDALLTAAGPITIAATLDSTFTTSLSRKDGWFSSKTTLASQTDQTTHASKIAAGGALTVVSGSDLSVTASLLTTGGDLTLIAAGSVAITSGQDLHQAFVSTTQSGLGLGALVGAGGVLDLVSTKRTTGFVGASDNAASTLTAGGDATVQAGRDLALAGSSVTAGGVASLIAAGNLAIDPGLDRATASLTRSTSGFGVTGSLGDGSASLSLGYHAKTTGLATDATTAVASAITGGTGVILAAGGNATLTAADLTSGGNLVVSAGGDLALLSQGTVTHTLATRSRTAVGLTAEVGQTVTGALAQLEAAAGTAGSGQGGDGYRAIGAASGAMQATDAALALTHPSATASLTLGAAHSQDHRTSDTQAARPTTIRAAGDVDLSAGHDLHAVGTQAQAGGRMDLSAGRDLSIESAQTRSASARSSSSWSAGVGIGASVGVGAPSSAGITAKGAMAQARGRDDGAVNLNAHLTAGTGLNSTSGADTVVAGAVITAPEVTVKAGGGLTVASRQDTEVGEGSSLHLSGSVTVGPGGGSGSASVGGGGSNRDRAWVGEQTGIRSERGLSVTVGGHTQVDGAVIASKTGQLALDTGTLGVTDLKDHDRSGATDVTVGGSFTTGGGDKAGDGQSQGQGQSATTPEGRPVGGSLSGRLADADKEGVSRATIGAGTITIRDPAHQGQDVGSINRDVGAAQAVTKDTKSGVSFYASTSAVQEAASGFQGIQDGASKLAAAIKEGFRNPPSSVAGFAKGDKLSDAVELRKTVLAAGGLPTAYASLSDEPEFTDALRGAVQAKDAQDEPLNPDALPVKIRPQRSDDGPTTTGEVMLDKLGQLSEAIDRLSPWQVMTANITVQVALGGPMAPVKALASSVILDAVAGDAIAKAEDAVSRTVFASMADRPWDDNAPEGSEQARLQSGAKMVANLAASAVTGKAIGKAGQVAGKGPIKVADKGSLKTTDKGPGGLCFVAGTPVLTATGYKAIEEIDVGDTVLSRDEASGRIVAKPVTRLYHNTNRAVLDLVLDDGLRSEVLGVTAEHPFFVVDRGWVGAGSLEPGDRIVGRASGEGRGGVLLVRAVTARPRLVDTYNFEVAQTHTYFVGALDAWVHNQCGTPSKPSSSSASESKSPTQSNSVQPNNAKESQFIANVDATFKNSSIWGKVIRHRGELVVQRTDIELSDQNINRMKNGFAPFVKRIDGQWDKVELHHVGRETGKLIEVTKTQNGYNIPRGGTLHIPGPGGPIRQTDFTSSYWKQRYQDFIGLSQLNP